MGLLSVERVSRPRIDVADAGRWCPKGKATKMETKGAPLYAFSLVRAWLAGWLAGWLVASIHHPGPGRQWVFFLLLCGQHARGPLRRALCRSPLAGGGGGEDGSCAATSHHSAPRIAAGSAPLTRAQTYSLVYFPGPWRGRRLRAIRHTWMGVGVECVECNHTAGLTSTHVRRITRLPGCYSAARGRMCGWNGLRQCSCRWRRGCCH